MMLRSCLDTWLANHTVAMMRSRLRVWLANHTVAWHLCATRFVQGLRIAAAARDPMRVQRALLQRILAQNASTTFGRRHGFKSIRHYEEFARRVPVSEFESLRSYVDAQIEHGEQSLTTETPSRYVRTSGTTGLPKDLPLTLSHLEGLRGINKMSLAFQQRVCPKAFDGSILAIVSPENEGTLANGRPFGSASGIVARSVPRIVQDKFVLPPEVLTIHDSHLRYLLILRLALARTDLSYVGAANPSTLLILGKLYRENHAALIRDLRVGSFFRLSALPDGVARVVAPRLLADPRRAAELSLLHRSAGTVRIADLWPALRLVVTWTCASAGVAVDALRVELPATTRILELGYVASEFRGTITLGKRSGSGWPTLDTHFFEFVERDKWDCAEPEYLTLDRIRKGVSYYIVVTTPSGLYRYFINDLVRVTGFLHKTPLLTFVQKGKGVTNITGEKLYESQVLTAVRCSLEQMGRTARFVMMLADEKARGYRLYVETEPVETEPVETEPAQAESAQTEPGQTQSGQTQARQTRSRPELASTIVADLVDRQLAALNIEYRAKRESLRLEPVRAHWLHAGAGEDYKRFCVRQGQREGQFKMVALAYQKDFAFDLNPLAEHATP